MTSCDNCGRHKDLPRDHTCTFVPERCSEYDRETWQGLVPLWNKAPEMAASLIRMRRTWESRRPYQAAKDREANDATKAEERERFADLVKRCGLPAYLSEQVASDNYMRGSGADKTLAQARAAGCRLIVLQGTSTAGKSWAAAKLLREAIAEAARDKMIPPGRWFNAIELATRQWFGPDVASLLEVLYRTRILVIDALGREPQTRGSDVWRSQLEGIIDARAQRPDALTILTTQLNALAFRDRYGESIWTRIDDACGWQECH